MSHKDPKGISFKFDTIIHLDPTMNRWNFTFNSKLTEIFAWSLARWELMLSLKCCEIGFLGQTSPPSWLNCWSVKIASYSLGPQVTPHCQTESCSFTSTKCKSECPVRARGLTALLLRKLQRRLCTLLSSGTQGLTSQSCHWVMEKWMETPDNFPWMLLSNWEGLSNWVRQ